MLKFIFLELKRKVIWFLKNFFRKLGIGLTSYSRLESLQIQAQDRSRQDLEFIQSFDPTRFKWFLTLLSKSKSQLRQDLFVLAETDFKREGFFVEFGATNGIELSNTYLLEMEFSWSGILAEPARVWEKQLRVNRPKSIIENLCVWKDSNSALTFVETADPELSTIASFSQKDGHKKARRKGISYEVQTVSLEDLLKKNNAPKYIDYLSIDTEGSEYEILSAFNFDEFNIKVITVEHNFTQQRELIFALLTKHGYKRKYDYVSDFDDWYVKD
jgi:FkbM family methyltransferase